MKRNLDTSPRSENDDTIISAENVGVSFISGYRTDDYKSKLYSYLLRQNQDTNQKTFWPLRNITFNGYKGEILGIIGSNGAGKTTLCKLITGILQPDEGSMRVDGKVSPLFSLGLGFKKDLTGRENVYLNGMMLGIKKIKLHEYFDQIHDFSGIGNFIDQPVKYYSSGMKARLGFSIATHMDPEILVVDEALNTGDLEFSQKAATKMKELVQKAKMVILVTHSLGYAEKNCNRLIWLEKGSIKGIGDPKDIVAQYKETIPKKRKISRPKLQFNQTVSNVTQNKVVVKADNLGVSYQLKNKRFWALKNVNFNIREGEVVGIIGKNGAGKSTLCKLLTEIIVPDEGKLQVEGDTTALLGYNSGFNAQLTGRDNVFLNGMLLGIKKNKIIKNFKNIVNFAELEKFIDKPVKQYSSGMKSRLGFSIAANLEPDIFIIDEALSAGDIAFKQKASLKIQEMIEEAKAVIVVSHSMSFVQRVCTRAIWVHKGKVYFDGNPNEVVNLYREYYNPAVEKRDEGLR